MADTFDDFVNRTVARAKPSIDWTQDTRRLDKAPEFYHLAEGFPRKYVDQGKVPITRSKSMKSTSGYEVTSLEVRIGAVKVRFDPIGSDWCQRSCGHARGMALQVCSRPENASARMIRVISRETSRSGGVGLENSTQPPNIKCIELEDSPSSPRWKLRMPRFRRTTFSGEHLQLAQIAQII